MNLLSAGGSARKQRELLDQLGQICWRHDVRGITHVLSHLQDRRVNHVQRVIEDLLELVRSPCSEGVDVVLELGLAVTRTLLFPFELLGTHRDSRPVGNAVVDAQLADRDVSGDVGALEQRVVVLGSGHRTAF